MNIDDDRIHAGRAVTAKWLSDEIRALTAGAREILEPRLEPGERVRAQLPDGTTIGSVTIGKAAESATVTDARALLAWVKAHAPTEIVESVNPAYVDLLKRRCKTAGYAHDDQGEIVPGIELRVGTASYRPMVDPDAVPLLRAKLADLISGGLLELPAGEQRRAHRALHLLVSHPAHCQVCGGDGVVLLERHYVEECSLPTPVLVICPHCQVETRMPIHHYHQTRSA